MVLYRPLSGYSDFKVRLRDSLMVLNLKPNWFTSQTLAICWPATHFTLTLFDHAKRPLICWAIIGTTTSCSRSVQMWVTSNIIVFPQPHHSSHSSHTSHSLHSSHASPSSSPLRESSGESGTGALVKEKMKMTRKRKWDWGAVGRRCALPAALIYFVMAWVEVLRREVERGNGSGVQSWSRWIQWKLWMLILCRC